MLSPEEKRLIAGILALLLLGATVKIFRQHVSVEHPAKVQLSGGDTLSKPRVNESRAH